jgi:hypothetical protein
MDISLSTYARGCVRTGGVAVVVYCIVHLEERTRSIVVRHDTSRLSVEKLVVNCDALICGALLRSSSGLSRLSLIHLGTSTLWSTNCKVSTWIHGACPEFTDLRKVFWLACRYTPFFPKKKSSQLFLDKDVSITKIYLYTYESR